MGPKGSDGGVSHPQICVGGIVVDGDSLLLIRRGHGPAGGRWSIPGGRVELGETLAQALVREIHEETNLRCVCGPLVGWTEIVEDDHHFVILDFEAVLMDDSEPVAGSDAAEVEWVPLIDVSEYRLVDGLADFLMDHDVIPTL